MSANFTPTLDGYTGQQPFRYWCQKVLPLVYDESLSYYELLNKVVAYLNNVITDVSTVEGNVGELLNAYQQLQNYVNDYFENLNVQGEINNKLDEMATDGTLSQLISPYVSNLIGDVVAEQIDGTVAEQIDNVVAEQIGEPTATATTAWLNENVNPVGSAVIVDDSLTISGAAADAKTVGDKSFLIRSVPANAETLMELNQIGVYRFINRAFSDYPADSDYNLPHTLVVIGEVYNANLYKQYLFEFTSATRLDKVWRRIINKSSNTIYSDWLYMGEGAFITNTSIGNVTSLVTVKKIGSYLIKTSDFQNITDLPAGIDTTHAASIINLPYTLATTGLTQIYFQYDGSVWYRIVSHSGDSIYKGWSQIYDANIPPTKVCAERTTVGITEISSLNKMGTYHVTGTQITDYPVDCNPTAQHSIIVSTNAYNGSYAYQYLRELTAQNTNDKIWERVISTQNGTVYRDWQRINIYPVEIPVDNSNYLKGKKLVTAGDSYTAAAFSGDDYHKNFGYYIAQRNEMTFVNSGINGSTMAVPNNGTQRNPFSVDRYLEVPNDTDYLTLWFGINDAANCTLGSIDDTENTTFYGAWNKVLSYYLTNRPFMKILIVVTTGANANFRNAIRNVAKKWGYPYLDWENDYAIPAFFDRTDMSEEARTLRRTAFGTDTGGIHPTAAWHEYASTIFESKLRSI